MWIETKKKNVVLSGSIVDERLGEGEGEDNALGYKHKREWVLTTTLGVSPARKATRCCSRYGAILHSVTPQCTVRQTQGWAAASKWSFEVISYHCMYPKISMANKHRPSFLAKKERPMLMHLLGDKTRLVTALSEHSKNSKTKEAYAVIWPTCQTRWFRDGDTLEFAKRTRREGIGLVPPTGVWTERRRDVDECEPDRSADELDTPKMEDEVYGLDDHAPRLGNAKEAVASLLTEEAFDLVFIDADKEGYPTYSFGQVADESFTSDYSRRGAVRTLLKMLKEEREVEATTIVITNVKGYGGFLYAIKL
ncbi:hypothetical protein F5141DRAFT_1063577 [Pisolithus sp. B1]|nr:hypothetical protein F5141DRAFT_1063577 [Pisolithus sp. B1]